MKNAVVKFLRDEEGATAIEYGLIAGLVSIAIIVALGALGTEISGLFGRITAVLEGVEAPAAGG